MTTKAKQKPQGGFKILAGRQRSRRPVTSRLSDAGRLDRIAEIIEAVDHRCLAADGPVTPTLQEMEQAEISEIYALAKRRK